MPNIFICGFKISETDDLKRIIDNLMHGLGLEEEAITSILSVKSESCDGLRKSTPYIWIRSTNQEEIFQIIDAFKEIGLQQDVEWDIIGGFIKAEEIKKT